TDVIVQLGILIFSVGVFYFLHSVPRRTLSSLRSKSRPSNLADRHFVQGAALLSRARSSGSRSAANKLAKSAAGEADKALALEPRDPAAHILKAMALSLMGHKSSALKSLDSALSLPAVKRLSEQEKGDALVKRAEIQLEVNRRRRVVDGAIDDLREATRLNPDNARAFFLLGQCHEIKDSKAEAVQAFEKALE
ncbi:hypothetical protein M569_06781, partial [Genlisea aurea]